MATVIKQSARKKALAYLNTLLGDKAKSVSKEIEKIWDKKSEKETKSKN